MRVCIDGSPLLVRSGGVKTYLHHLIRQMQSLKGAETVKAFPYLGRIPELNHERSVAGKISTFARLVALALTTRGFIPAGWMVPKADVFHASNLMRQHPGTHRLTATIYDMTCWLFPELHTAGTLQADRESAERIWSRADALIAISHKSKEDAVKILGVKEERIHVVYPGVEQEYFRVSDADVARVRSRYSLQRPYVLFVSTIEPRKNLDRLIAAYRQLAGSTREAFDLAVAGPGGWKSEQTLASLRSGSIPGVKYLGYVAEGDMLGLFAGATVFAYPSLYEGFGLPVLQAMAAGVPVLAGATGSLPEVASDPAVFVDPYSVDDIRNSLERLLTSPSERAIRSAEGRAHAANFRWDTCAEETWRVFERIV
ncbi:MAG: glycosyltransferase family 1 protein [Acidobacteriota bacterium]